MVAGIEQEGADAPHLRFPRRMHGDLACGALERIFVRLAEQTFYLLRILGNDCILRI